MFKKGVRLIIAIIEMWLIELTFDLLNGQPLFHSGTMDVFVFAVIWNTCYTASTLGKVLHDDRDVTLLLVLLLYTGEPVEFKNTMPSYIKGPLPFIQFFFFFINKN